MQFKRGGWRYSEADGVVTMPGNARQAFPAKRDGDGGGGGGGGGGGRREAHRGDLEIGAAGKERGGGWGQGERNGDNRTIQRDIQVVYRVFAFTQFSARASQTLRSRYYAITIYPARRRRGAVIVRARRRI